MSLPRYPKYKDSGVEWLGEVPEHWVVSKLGYESWVRARLGWKGLKAEEYVDDGFAFLSTPNIKGAAIDFENVNFITEERYLESPEIALREGDVLLAKDGSTLGTVNVVRSLPRPATVNSSIAVITPHPSMAGAYLHYLFQSSFMKDTIQQIKGGMGVPHLFQEDLNKFWVPLPQVSEQLELAKFLDRETGKIDALVEEQRRLIELLKEKRQAVISHAVTKGLNHDARMKDSGVEWLGKVPAHWDICRIKQVAKLESGHTPSKQVPEYWENCEIQWISLNDSKQLAETDYISETAFQINELGLKNSSARILPSGAVVFTRDATIGLAAITTRPMAVSQHLIAWCPSERVSALYLLRVFNVMKPFLDSYTFGATIKTIGMADVSKLITPVPPIGEQNEITGFLISEMAKIDELTAEATHAIDLLQERRTALVSAAVTGKIDVRATIAKSVQSATQYSSGFAHQLLAAEILDRCNSPRMGRIKLQKLIHLCEYHGQIDEVQGDYRRKAAGPFDAKAMAGIRLGLEKQRWFEEIKDGERYLYQPLEKRGEHRNPGRQGAHGVFTTACAGPSSAATTSS
jgi:type I restriction enzyme S subunit